MSKIILHIDLNQFFVRCEEIKNPNLIGKPVIIGHDGRGGIVSTCSYEARKFGIKSGMPTFMAIKLNPKVIMIPGDYKFYSSMSRKFINFIKTKATNIEQASIDECYVDMTKELKDVKNVEQYLLDMQNELYEKTGLKCSIGVAPTKFLAKMGSDMKKPMGLTIIRRKDIRKMIYPLPISDFYGIGKKTTPKLEKIGIKTIGDLAIRVNNDDKVIKNELGKFFFAVKDMINGQSSDYVDSEPFDPKSIGNSHTLPFDTNSYNDLKENLVILAEEVSQRAKEANKVGTTVQVVLKDNGFKVINRSISFSKPTNDFDTIKSYTIQLLDKNYDSEKMIRLVGVTLQNLINPSEVTIQMSIFDDFEKIKEECATKLLISELNRKMNKSVFKTAAELELEKRNGSK